MEQNYKDINDGRKKNGAYEKEEGGGGVEEGSKDGSEKTKAEPLFACL